jgi:hypothetical protein
MKIWKLIAANPSNPIWKDWKPDPILVRAKTEAEARRLAELRTTEAFPSRPGQPIPLNPWGGRRKIGDPMPTICEDVTERVHNEYPAEGEAVVLNRAEGDG